MFLQSYQTERRLFGAAGGTLTVVVPHGERVRRVFVALKGYHLEFQSGNHEVKEMHVEASVQHGRDFDNSTLSVFFKFNNGGSSSGPFWAQVDVLFIGELPPARPVVRPTLPTRLTAPARKKAAATKKAAAKKSSPAAKKKSEIKRKR